MEKNKLSYDARRNTRCYSYFINQLSVSYDSAIQLIYPSEMNENVSSHRSPYVNVYGNLICSLENLRSIQTMYQLWCFHIRDYYFTTKSNNYDKRKESSMHCAKVKKPDINCYYMISYILQYG